jgi:hypothetical protein
MAIVREPEHAILKKAIPILALLYTTAGLCAPAGWLPLRASANASYFVDASSKAASSGTADVSILANFNDVQQASFDRNLAYRSTVSRYRIDCASSQFTALGIRYYAQAMALGQAVRSYTFDHAASQSIIPWSRLAEVQAKVCETPATSSDNLDGLKPSPPPAPQRKPLPDDTTPTPSSSR